MLQKTHMALFSRSTTTRTFGVTLFADSSRHEMRTRVTAARLSVHELGRASVFGSSAWWATSTTFLLLLFYLSLGLSEQIFLSALAFIGAGGSWNWDWLANFSHKGFCLLHSMEFIVKVELKVDTVKHVWVFGVISLLKVLLKM